MKYWIIRNTVNDLFWSLEEKWDDRFSAEIFSDEDRIDFNLPAGGEWVPDSLKWPTPKPTDFETEELEKFPPGENPFLHDIERMGTSIDNNLTIMYVKFADNTDIIVHDKRTGARLKISFPVQR
jgi:hypothetical protein